MSVRCRIRGASQKVERQSEKRAIEVARYVLPVAAFTTMVHTLSGIVLHRLWRMQAANDTPTEARQVIGEMVARVREVDPQFFDRFDNQPMDDLPEWQQPPRDGEAFAREFDARLAGLTSRLIDFSPSAIAADGAGVSRGAGIDRGGMPRRRGA